MTIATAEQTILIVDDDPDIVLGLEDLLRHDGYRVDSAGTCADAISCGRQRRYNAVLLDLNLPDGDGLSVLKVLQEVDQTMPVIILTAVTSEERTVGTLTEGAFACLTKPYHRDQLRATIQRAIGVHALARRAEHVEHALSESEERFRSLVESATDAIVLADQQGLIISWNRASSRLFGYTDSEAIGQLLTLIIPERYRAAHTQGIQRLHATGQPRLIGKIIELEGLRKDGTEFPIELSLATWKAAAGSFYSGIIRDISERKLAETALRESQERFHQLVEHIKDVFWLTDPSKSQMIYVSPGYEEIWGRSCDSLYASPKSWLDAIHPDDRARVLFAATSRQTSGMYNEEYRIVRLDGSVRWIWDRAFPIRDRSGTTYRIAGIAEDITERKQREALLQASQERLDLAVRGSTDGLWDGHPLPNEHWLSPQTPVWWSARLKQMLGFDEKEFPDLLESWSSRLHPDDKARVFATLTAHIERKEPYDVEYRLLNKQGVFRWFRARGQAIWDEHDRLLRMAGSLQCVTDRKQAEEELRASEERLRLALAGSNMGIWDWNVRTNNVFWSEEVETFFGLHPGAFPGTYAAYLELICLEDRGTVLRAIQHALEAQADVEFEHRVVWSDGTLHWLSWSGTVHRDTHGAAQRVLGIVRDITARKRA